MIISSVIPAERERVPESITPASIVTEILGLWIPGSRLLARTGMTAESPLSDCPPHPMAHVVQIAARIPRHALQRLCAAVQVGGARDDLDGTARRRGERERKSPQAKRPGAG